MFKMSRPVLYLFIATLAVAAYLLTTPSTPTRHSPKSKPVVSVIATNADYTSEDYKAHFTTPVLVSRNAFNPLVVRKNNLIAALAAAGAVPADFAGGDPNWFCTGSATVDGVMQILLENKATGDGVFLKQGDHWKNCVVSQVMEDGVVLVGPGGDAKTIHVKQDSATPDETDQSGTTPVQLSGPIGGQTQISGGQVTQAPLPSAAPATTNNSTVTTDDNNGG